MITREKLLVTGQYHQSSEEWYRDLKHIHSTMLHSNCAFHTYDTSFQTTVFSNLVYEETFCCSQPKNNKSLNNSITSQFCPPQLLHTHTHTQRERCSWKTYLVHASFLAPYIGPMLTVNFISAQKLMLNILNKYSCKMMLPRLHLSAIA